MNRFALIAVTGCLAFALTACGENNNKPVAGPDHVVVPQDQTQPTPAPQPQPEQPSDTQSH